MADAPSICILTSLQNKNANMQTSHRVPIKCSDVYRNQWFTFVLTLHHKKEVMGVKMFESDLLTMQQFIFA